MKLVECHNIPNESLGEIGKYIFLGGKLQKKKMNSNSKQNHTEFIL